MEAFGLWTRATGAAVKIIEVCVDNEGTSSFRSGLFIAITKLSCVLSCDKELDRLVLKLFKVLLDSPIIRTRWWIQLTWPPPGELLFRT